MQPSPRRQQLFRPFFLFALIALIPLLLLGIHNGSKLIKIYITSQNDYVVTKTKLLMNHVRKYDNRATYQFNYQGQMLEESAGSILWSSVGDEVTFYYEKMNTANNCIVSGLYFLALGQWMLFILGASYVIFKLIRSCRTP